jgi:hypothetical protein
MTVSSNPACPAGSAIHVAELLPRSLPAGESTSRQATRASPGTEPPPRRQAQARRGQPRGIATSAAFGIEPVHEGETRPASVSRDVSTRMRIRFGGGRRVHPGRSNRTAADPVDAASRHERCYCCFRFLRIIPTTARHQRPKQNKKKISPTTALDYILGSYALIIRR